MKRASVLVLWAAGWVPAAALADEPATAYIFPAGGQRGARVECRVGGMNLSAECGFRMLGSGLDSPAGIRSMPTLVLPGPHHQNPIAQQAYDYPRDMAATIKIAPDAAPGGRFWYCTTSEGATQLRCFVVGDLPEILEDERGTRQGRPQPVALPVTVNGRIYPRGDLDEYGFAAKAGDLLSCEVMSQRLGHKLDARLELFDDEGRSVAANDDGLGRDPMLTAVLPADARYVLRIHDLAFEGNPDYVYRLTLRVGAHVTHVFPAGGRRGEPGRVRLYGAGLSREGFLDRERVVDSAAISVLDRAGGFTLVSGPDLSSLMSGAAPPGPEAVRGRLPVSRGFQLGDLPELIEEEPNDGPARARKITPPAVMNGQIQAIGDADEFSFAAVKGQKLDLELFGQRLGSPITAVLLLRDSSGKQLLRQEGDGSVLFVAPGDGDYLLRVHELHRETHGGTEYIYRLVVAPPRPEFRLLLEKDALGVLPGQTAKVKLNVSRSGGFAGDIELEFRGLPGGIKAGPAVIPAAAKQVELSFSAAADAPLGDTHRMVLIGGATVGGGRLARAAEVPVAGSVPGQPPADSLALTVIHPPLFTIDTEDVYGFANRGATFVQKFSVTRLNGFGGEIELGPADRQARYLQGATGPVVLLAPGATEVDYPAFLPETMELNRTTRIVLTGTARVRDASGRPHTVTLTTKKQIVARVSPAILTLSAESGFVEALPGREVPVRLRLARARELRGPVRVEAILPEDARGITAGAAEAREDEDSVVIVLRFARDATPGDEGTLLFRASGRRDGHPVVAETTVIVQ